MTQGSARRRVLVIVAAIALVAIAVVAVVHGGRRRAVPPSRTTSGDLEATSPTRFVPPDGTRYLGVSTNGTGIALSRFLAEVGRTRVAIYNRWTQPMGSFGWIIDEVKRRPDVALMISWNLPGRGSQASIADGSIDTYLRERASEIQAYRRPVFLRLNWEFNGCYYPWATYSCSGAARAGNTPRDFVAAWRHVAAFFRDVPNVTFVWSPTLFAPTPSGHGLTMWDYYPGDDVVGWIGMDAYPGSAPWEVMTGADQGMNAIDAFARSHRKPVMVAEWGLNDKSTGDDPRWVQREVDWIESHPAVKAALYFDYDARPSDGKDYRLASFPQGARALKAVVAAPSWLTSLCLGPGHPVADGTVLGSGRGPCLG